jgi:hypothetical protein
MSAVPLANLDVENFPPALRSVKMKEEKSAPAADPAPVEADAPPALVVPIIAAATPAPVPAQAQGVAEDIWHEHDYVVNVLYDR